MAEAGCFGSNRARMRSRVTAHAAWSRSATDLASANEEFTFAQRRRASRFVDPSQPASPSDSSACAIVKATQEREAIQRRVFQGRQGLAACAQGRGLMLAVQCLLLRELGKRGLPPGLPEHVRASSSRTASRTAPACPPLFRLVGDPSRLVVTIKVFADRCDSRASLVSEVACRESARLVEAEHSPVNARLLKHENPIVS